MDPKASQSHQNRSASAQTKSTQFQFKYPTFADNERNALELQIQSHFRKHKLLAKEKDCTHETLNKCIDILDVNHKFESVSALQKWLYECNESPFHRYQTSNLKFFCRLPHNDTLWRTCFLHFKNVGNSNGNIFLWRLIQSQTVFLITDVFNFLPSDPIRKQLKECHSYNGIHKALFFGAPSDSALSTAAADDEEKQKDKGKEQENENEKEKSVKSETYKGQMVTINEDSADTAIYLKKLGLNPLVLNLANQYAPAAAVGVGCEAGTQEESLFKRSTYFLSLWPHRQRKIHSEFMEFHKMFDIERNGTEKENVAKQTIDGKQGDKAIDGKEKEKGKCVDSATEFYPMHDEFGGIYSPNVLFFRASEKYGYRLFEENERCVLSVIAVAAKQHWRKRQKLSEAEVELFKWKTRRICEIALLHSHDCLVLGALGCGAFANPPSEVSRIMFDVLKKEFGGCFRVVAFAIIFDENSPSDVVDEFAKWFPVTTLDALELHTESFKGQKNNEKQ